MALSLGRSRGAVLIGQPLDISLQVTLGPGESDTGSCLDADVFYADSRLEKSRVRVALEKSSATREDLVRIRTSTPIDEPVVTVHVRAGCTQRTEKRYVMLAELAPDQALPAPVPAQQPSAETLPVAGSALSQKSRYDTRARSKSASVRSAQADVAQTESAPPARSRVPTPRSAPPAVATQKKGARLRLEPLDLTVELMPQLKASPEMGILPAVTAEQRMMAAATWKALTMQGTEVMRDAQKISAIEAGMQGLQTEVRKNQASLADFRTELAKAQAERYANTLVYVLGGLLALVIGALVYLGLRRAGQHEAKEKRARWWRGADAAESGWVNSVQESGLSAMEAQASAQTRSTVHAGLSARAPLAREAGDTGDSGFQVSRYPAARSGPESWRAPLQADRTDFAMSMTHASLAVKAEELLDVQQQADFFASLGQYEQAIELLLSHIGDNAQTSALVFLDLFNLYHQLGRRQDYEVLREQFNKLFNATIPVFDLYTDASPGLESHQTALTRIEALWPSPKVLDVLEESIFRRPESNGKAFDLEAYRELLLLYAVAKQIIGPRHEGDSDWMASGPPDLLLDDTPVQPVKFKSTSIQPLSASIGEESRDSMPALLPLLPELFPAPSMDIDIDLTEPASSTAAKPVHPLPAESHSDNIIEFDLSGFSGGLPGGTKRSP
ncbi:MAG: hypothetical protein ABIP46_12505 [Polaromonas sp.]